MKGISKPLSSPSRAEKFPPPLMRFLRSNVGSRSRSRCRSRSRSSPIFYLRGRRSAPAAIEEPSSPKVTCIGQVRIRRSKPRRAVKKRQRRRSKSLCFGNNPLGGILCKCGSIFGWGYSKKVDSKIENLNNGHSAENKRGFLEPYYSPPKNALMLTRCRSAPYRSSSLGARFWNVEKSDELAAISNREKEEEEEKELEETENSAEKVEEMKKTGGDAQRLRRCKSEPASTGERLVVSQPSLTVR